MTLPDATSAVTHTGNGTTTLFPYSFIIPDEDYVEVTIFNIFTGLEGDPLSPSLYTITGIGDENGGEVEYPLTGNPLSDDYRINIRRVVPNEQELALTGQSSFTPDVLEGQLDRIVMMIQQVKELADRSVKVELGSTTDPAELIDSLLAALAGLPDGESSTYTRRSFTAGTASGEYDGISLTTFPIPYVPGYVEVYVNGIKLLIDVDYTADNGTEIVLTDALAADTLIELIAFNVTSVEINQPILRGAGVPGSGLGEPGQYYINETTVDLYNKTDETTWALVLNFKGTVGDQGDAGPANTLTVGTVTAGVDENDVDVEITGTAPDQTINFVVPRGQQGNAGNNGLSFVWQGDWDIATQYNAQDVVRDGGATWIASQASLGEAPPTLPTESNAFWELHVLDGADGEDGAPGPNFTVNGAYGAGTSYDIGDTVSYDGGSYVSRVDANIGNTPDVSPTEWQVVALQGDPGAQGDPGVGDMEAANFPTLISLEGLSLVQGDILYATAADTLARLPKGTAGQELRMNGGATAPEWYTPETGGSMTLLGILTIASGTTLWPLTDIPAGYRQFYIEVENVGHDNGTSRALTLALSSTNGAAYGSPGTISAVTTAAAGSTGAVVVYGVSSTFAGGKMATSVLLTSTVATTVAQVATNTAAVVDALRFGWNGAGNFDSGEIRVYGVK